MKKIISLFLIIIASFALISCSSTTKKNPNNNNLIKNDKLEKSTNKNLVVGVIEYPPFISYENMELSGPYIDIIKSVLNSQNLKYEFKILPWTRLMEAVKDGTVDMAIPFTDTPERRSYMNFLEEAIGLNQYNIAVPFDSKIKYDGDLSSLSGYDIGIVQDYYYSKELENAILDDSFKIDTAYSTNNNIMKLIQGRVDLIVENFTVVNEYIKNNPRADAIKILEKPFNYRYSYIVFSKKQSFENIIKGTNSRLKDLKENGDFYEIFESYGLKYYSDSLKLREVKDPPPPRFIQSEENGTLMVGILGNTKPYAYYENDKLTGFTVDLISEVLNRIGVRYKLIDLPFSRMLEELKSGSLDIGTDLYLTKERQEFLEYPPLPFTGYPTVIFKNVDTEFNYSGDIKDLAPFNISYVRGYNIGPLEKYKNSVEYNLMESNSPADNIDQLISRRSDLIIDIKSTAQSYIDSLNLNSKIESVEPPVFYDYSYVVFSKKNNLNLLVKEYDIAIKALFEDGTIKTLSKIYDIPYLEFEELKK